MCMIVVCNLSNKDLINNLDFFATKEKKFKKMLSNAIDLTDTDIAEAYVKCLGKDQFLKLLMILKQDTRYNPDKVFDLICKKKCVKISHNIFLEHLNEASQNIIIKNAVMLFIRGMTKYMFKDIISCEKFDYTLFLIKLCNKSERTTVERWISIYKDKLNRDQCIEVFNKIKKNKDVINNLIISKNTPDEFCFLSFGLWNQI